MKDLPKTFNVRVSPHAKQSQVLEKDGVLHVYTNVAPEKGKANNAVIELLAEYLKVPKTSISIIRGLSGRTKVIKID